MAFFTYNNVSLYYVKEGKGHPVVFISGLGSKNSWKAQIPYFKGRMTAITLHNRGTGRSSRPNYQYTMHMYVEDVRSLLDFLNVEEQIHLCGVSMGA
jgi:pimeloyl-ACP methyl ester carboxylesterase